MTPSEQYMARCLQLARKGLATTYPNPMVGSIVVHEDRIIGEGWHQKAGMAHAEVNAIASVKDASLLTKSTIYVSLEPCSHFGKTPPCSDLIIAKGIKKVVIGCTDPNPKVAGRGIKKLKEAGCEVVLGVLEKQCTELNKRFFTFHREIRPYILLKWAQSSDGFLAPTQRYEQKPVWLTNEYSRQLAHKMRSEEQAILVGTQTVLDDDPSLTTRTWHGTSPTRIVLDRSLKIPKAASIYSNEAPTIVINEQKEVHEEHPCYEMVDFLQPLAPQICKILYKHDLQSVIVEGGAQTLQTFIDANLWDEAHLFKGPMVLGNGVPSPIGLSGTIIKEQDVMGDLLTIYKNDCS